MGRCRSTDHWAITLRNMANEVMSPAWPAAMAASTWGLRLDRPNHTGVPTAPKVTGKELRIRQTMAAARAGKPRLSSSGAAMAAGVPNPAAPSRKAEKMAPMMITCTRRSRLMP